jgi:hypothetical protein
MTATIDSTHITCRIEQLARATCAAVYDVLLDVERWPEWSPTVSEAVWERRGEPGTGLHGIRRVCTSGDIVRDRVTAGSRPHHHAFARALPDCWPFGNMQSDIRLVEHDLGCQIIWSVECTVKDPVFATSVEFKIRHIYTRWAAALADAAERPRSSTPLSGSHSA